MHLAFVLSLLAAAVLSIIVASSASFRIFRRYRLPLCGWWRTAEDDLEIGPGQARETRGSEITPEKENDGGRATVRRFRWSEIESSTENFSPGTVIGQGGSSTVYLSHLPNSVLAAVKLHRPSERLHRAFRQELDVLLYLRHPHIVHLLGYCDDREDEGALVFEYLLNGCLHKKLHGGEEALPWERRMAVAYQVAQALEYLHEVCDPQVVHCDVKAANVLLDGQMDAKLCDFGSARVGFSAAIAPPRSGRELVVGSLGYVDPHYLRSGMVSKKSDVYSFGVLLLELVTGEEAFDSGRELRLTSAMDLVLRDPEGRAAEAMDARLGGEYDIGEARTVVTVAAMCVGENPSLRPSMGEVVRILGEKAASSIATAAGESSGKKKVIN